MQEGRPGSASADIRELLERHRPIVRSDSGEHYGCDAIELWMPEPGALRPSPDKRSRGAYRRLYRELLREHPGWRDRVYGHASVGSDGRLWLEYWFFAFYNDFTLLGPWLGAGLHEGDWEMIQLRMDPTGQAPDLAVYAQHQDAAARSWDPQGVLRTKALPATAGRAARRGRGPGRRRARRARLDPVERVGERPVIYVGRGSHACWFTPGWHWTGLWWERANGAGRRPELRLEIVEATTLTTDRPGPEPVPVHATRASLTWPGRWGHTVPRPGWRGLIDSPSPHGPVRQRQWDDPARFLDWVR